MKHTPLKQKTPLRSHKGLNKVSPKRQWQSTQETILTAKLLAEQGGKCYDCGTDKPDWRGWQKHELTFRSQGGDPLDKNNCIVLCAKCHSARHGIIEK